LLDEMKRELIAYRLNRAKECLELAEELIERDILTAANRLYYAIYYALRSVLAIEGVDFKKHSGVIAYFNKNYIKTGEFDKKYSELIFSTEHIRIKSDYDDLYVVSKKTVIYNLIEAREFYDEIKKYIEQKI